MNTSRRSLLMGGLGALGAAGASFMSPRTGVAGGSAPAGKNLIVVFVNGGWDITYAFDTKAGVATIDAPVGKARKVGGVTIHDDASRPVTRAFFEQHGELCTIVNGIQVQSINHPDCSKRMLTGTASETNPDFAAIAAYELGKELPAPYLALGATAYTGPLGSIAVRTGTLTQVKGLMDPDLGFPTMGNTRFAPSPDEAELIDRYVHARVERERATRGALGYNARRLDDFVASLDRGERFKKFQDAFPPDFSFSLDLRVQSDIALRAIQEGLSHSVHLEGGFAGWDTHTENGYQSLLHEDLFDVLAQLATQLKTRPGKSAGSKMIDETVVAVVSEMGRTPMLNDEGGKDHWPVTSAMFFGGGLLGARTLGATGDKLQAVTVDYETGKPSAAGNMLQYSNIVAALLQAVGVDPANYLDNTEPFHALLA